VEVTLHPVRPAEPSDSDAIAAAHICGWRVGYRGLFPDEYLDADEFATARLERWRAWTWPAFGGATAQMFVVELAGRVVGFGHAGPERVEPACDESGLSLGPTLSDARGEVYGFYLHPDAWGSGAAAPLMRRCEAHLVDHGFTEAVLWVLRDNPRARRFYEREGWHWTGEEAEWPGPQSISGPPLIAPELQYGRRLV
jgi:GNAT superfamily N-acetyltransferase